MITEEPLIRPCKGDCGHMTRPRDTPGRQPHDKTPGTVSRYDGKYCAPCYNKFSPVAQQRRDREEAKKQREKELSLAAAFKARDEIEAGRRRRRAEAERRAAVREQMMLVRS